MDWSELLVAVTSILGLTGLALYSGRRAARVVRALTRRAELGAAALDISGAPYQVPGAVVIRGRVAGRYR